MSAPPMGVTSRIPNISATTTMIGKRTVFAGLTTSAIASSSAAPSTERLTIVLSFINDRPLRQNFLQLSGGDQAAGESERADDHFEADFAHAKPRDMRNAHVIFRDTDHRRGKRAERVAQSGPLRHGGHLHHAEGNANGRADDQRDDDPLVLDEFGIAERGADGQRRGDFSRQHAAPRASRANSAT